MNTQIIGVLKLHVFFSLFLTVLNPVAGAGILIPKGSVAVGLGYTCVNTADGVRCWGKNDAGQATPPADLTGVRQIAAQYKTTCALTDIGVECWGVVNASRDHNDSVDMRLVDGRYFWEGSDSFVNPRSMVVGNGFACLMVGDGVKCSQRALDPPPDLGHPTQLVAGYRHACALTDDGVRCWGDDHEGETNVPANLIGPMELAAGDRFTCAQDAMGVKCWGSILEDPSYFVTDPRDLSAGGSQVCVDSLARNGSRETVCWGQRASIGGLSPARYELRLDLAISSSHACAVTAGAEIMCWGINSHGQFYPPPTLVNPVRLFAGSEHTCALDSDGQLKCWGLNRAGFDRIRDPIPSTAQFAASRDQVLAIHDNQVWRWSGGFRRFFPDRYVNPIAVSGGDDGYCVAFETPGIFCRFGLDPRGSTWEIDSPIKIANYGSRRCAITDSGLHCSTIRHSGRPHDHHEQPPTLGDAVTDIAVGDKHSCAIAGGAVVCWGGDVYNQASPPLDLVDPHSLVAGTNFNCALSEDRVRCWGLGYNEGDGNPIPPISHPRELVAGNHHACAIGDDGVACWGRDTAGQVQVPTAVGDPSFGEVDLRYSLRRISRALYGEKRTFLLFAADLSFEGSHERENLFMFFALKPFLAELRSSAVSDYLSYEVPIVEDLFDERYGMSSLGDFDRNDLNLRTTIALLREKLVATKQFLSRDARSEIDDIFLPLFERKLARSHLLVRDGEEVASHFRTHRMAVSQLATERLSPFLAAIHSLLLWLEGA